MPSNTPLSINTIKQRTTLLALTKTEAIDAGHLKQAFEEICRSAALALDLERVSIWSYDRSREAIVCEELYERTPDKHSSGIVLFQSDFPQYFDYLREERILAAHNAHTEPATAAFSAPYLTPLGINSMLDAPIRLAGKLWGVVCHEQVGPHRNWTNDEQIFGASMADFTSRALAAAERARAQQDLAELNANLEAIVTQRTAELTQALELLKTAQAQLVEREKLASLGELVAGIAHEVNTPLGVSITAASAWDENLRQLRTTFSTGAMKRSDLERFFENSEQLANVLQVNLSRAAELVKTFKQVAVRQSANEVEIFPLGEVLQGALTSLNPEIRRHHVEVSVLADPTVHLKASPGFVFQLVSNLVMNAIIHAFPDGRQGWVRFELQRVSPTEALLQYEDNGVGATPEVLRRMWDPFFTTKRGAGGSGLGLHIVWNLVVNNLGGRVEAKCESGKGLQLHFHFPCLKEGHA